MFDIKKSECDSYFSAQLAASFCYKSSVQSAYDSASKIDVKNTTYPSEHHTTLQHAPMYVTLDMDNIPVSLVTFGLHLIHPFYNTCQRSGRYCTEMFKVNNNTSAGAIDNYVRDFINSYIHKCSDDYEVIIDWVLTGFEFFNNELPSMIDMAEEAMKSERPHFSRDYQLMAKRIAQEQLRCVISTIVPTGLQYTANILTLAAMAKSAWNSPYKNLTKAMLNAAITDDKLRDVYSDVLIDNEVMTWHPRICKYECDVINEPVVKMISCPPDYVSAKLGRYNKLHDRIDLTQFHPNANLIDSRYTSDIKSEISASVATFGQDQRHRTISRSLPEITGDFYIPPLLRKNPKYTAFIRKHMGEYLRLCRDVGIRDMIYFIPYGAVVKYVRKADTRGWFHSQRKRLCFNAQEEISKISELELKQMPKIVLKYVSEPCCNGVCIEGSRYCGRDMINKKSRILI
jgi:hypothetical protein